ncbi:sugar O-acetyltransferase [Lactococcus lactis]|uniref:sugar O-acetyltransferase n=1 Tax=Lactococcus lactis TaxID=1358 RepID=UPI002418499A|nr:sugar O-acetyltransferase [Lactococcus lactis]MDG4990274.1 sugar O-acetyltransferase [Lactococcus lactis]
MVDEEKIRYYNNKNLKLTEDIKKCQKRCNTYNLLQSSSEKRKNIKEIIELIGINPQIEPPFHCDFGYNIEIGDNFYSNYNLTILDEAKVLIGNNVLIGPNCGIYSAEHPISIKNRNKGDEFAKNITIGDNVWIGGSVTILAGVTIGSNSTIGAGSVVTKDIPSGVVAVGNPCKVLRKLTDKELD